MPNPNPSAIRIGALLVLAAMIATTVVAWQGLQNHRKLVWSEARDLAEEVADRFEQDVRRDMREIRFYQYPPTPGAFEFDAQATLEDLREQTNSEERTSAGLPVAVLAAFEIAKRTGNIRDGELARDLAKNRWPDLTSLLILERLEGLAEKNQWKGDFSHWEAEWKSDEEARDLIRKIIEDEWLSGEGWIAHKGALHYFRQTGNESFFYTSLDEDSPLWNKDKNIGIQMTSSDLILGHQGTFLTKRNLIDAHLSVRVADPDLIETEWRNRRRDTFLILGLSSLVTGAGMWVMIRGILKEKKIAHAKSQFVASVTHELRAPVGSMRLMADTLQSGKIPPDKAAEFHRLMSRESARLSVLIENVMDLARVEDGQRVLRKESVQFEELVDEVCEMLTMQAEEKGMSFKRDGSPLEVEADPVALRQVLVNLIDNALKFSPKGGVIFLSWGKGWWFSVADEGPGVDDKIRPHIFERFYRGEDELTRQTKGVGIGLSLVKELVELHGGSVSVSKGKGAEFKVSFSKP